MEGLEVEVPEICSSSPELRYRGIDQMEPADDAHDRPFITHLAGVLGDIADPGMRASRDDDKPLFRPIGEGRIIHQPIGFGPAIRKEDLPLARIHLLEREPPR